MYPILLNLGPFSLSSLWCISTIGFLISVKIFLAMAQKRKLRLNILVDNGLALILVTVISSRLITTVTNIIKYGDFSWQNITGFFYFWDRNFSIWIAFFTFLILLIYFLNKNKENILTWLDAISIPTLVSLIFINIGKYLDGSGYGEPSNLPWAVSFENIQVKYTVPIHPTQLYQFLYVTAITFTLIYLYKTSNKLDKDGSLAIYSTFFYCLCRFFEEFLRGDNVIMIGPIRFTQLITAILIIIVSTYIIKKYNRKFKL